MRSSNGVWWDLCPPVVGPWNGLAFRDVARGYFGHMRVVDAGGAGQRQAEAGEILVGDAVVVGFCLGVRLWAVGRLYRARGRSVPLSLVSSVRRTAMACACASGGR